MFNSAALELLLFCFCIGPFRMVTVKGQDASEQEICLPLRNTLSPRPSNVQQGIPGKMGPRGLPGLAGRRGGRGVAGRCACEPSEIAQLNRTIQALTGKTI